MGDPVIAALIVAGCALAANYGLSVLGRRFKRLDDAAIEENERNDERAMVQVAEIESQDKLIAALQLQVTALFEEWWKYKAALEQRDKQIAEIGNMLASLAARAGQAEERETQCQRDLAVLKRRIEHLEGKVT